jgi:Holliday junction DNA helicase RuvB
MAKVEVVGNQITLTQIMVAATSALTRNCALPHVLLAGAAGCGKTTTANWIAQQIGVKFIMLSADSLRTFKDVKSLAQQLDYAGYLAEGEKVGQTKPAIVFLDEIHNLPLKGQEYLGIAMEQWVLPVQVKGGEEILQWLPEFTLVGATTNDGKLSKPFRDRFKLRFVYTTYSFSEAQEIVRYHARRLKVEISPEAVDEVAKRGRGVPRILVGYLERVRDYAVAHGRNLVTKDDALTMFQMMNVNDDGLTSADIALLIALFKTNAPVGLENLSIMLNESPGTISGTLEPFLIQKGLIVRGGRGRIITNEGIDYLADREYIDNMYAMKVRMERM